MKIIQVNMLRKGERFKRNPGDKEILVRGDYVFRENKYACSPLDSPRQKELLAGTEQVYQVFAYTGIKKNE